MIKYRVRLHYIDRLDTFLLTSETGTIQEAYDQCRVIDQCFCFNFEILELLETEHPYTVVPTTLKTSKKYYMHGFVEELHDVEVKDEKLYAVMIKNGWNNIIKGVVLNWTAPVDEKHVLLDEEKVYNSIPQYYGLC